MRSVRLKQVAEVRYGLGQPPPTAVEGVPILRATNIERGRINPKGLIFAALADLPLGRAPLLEAGEVLVVRSGAYTGDSAMVTPDWEGSAPGYDLRLTPRSIEPLFLAYQMLSTPVLDQIELAKGRAAQPHLNAEDLGDVLVTTSSPQAERAIAEYLDAECARIDALVDIRRTLIDLIGERFQRAVETLLVKAAPSPIPLKRLLRARLAYGVLVPEWTDEPDSVRLVRISDVTDMGEVPGGDALPRIPHELSSEYKRTVLAQGDVVVSVVGTIGRSFVVGQDLAGANLSRALARVQLRADVLPDLVRWNFKTTEFTRFVAQVTQATAQNVINLEDLANYPVRLPSNQSGSEALSRRLQELSASHEALLSALSRQATSLVERRQAVITAVVTGQLEIPEVAA